MVGLAGEWLARFQSTNINPSPKFERSKRVTDAWKFFLCPNCSSAGVLFLTQCHNKVWDMMLQCEKFKFSTWKSSFEKLTLDKRTTGNLFSALFILFTLVISHLNKLSNKDKNCLNERIAERNNLVLCVENVKDKLIYGWKTNNICDPFNQ